MMNGHSEKTVEDQRLGMTQEPQREADLATQGASGNAPPEKYAWAARLAVLARQLRTVAGDDRQRARGEAWSILNASISMYLRVHARRIGPAPQEEAEQIAANKALDLLCRIEAGSWELADHSPAAIAGFLSHVARNGLIDWFRRERPRDRLQIEEEGVLNPEPTLVAMMSQTTVSPDAGVAGKEFVQTLSGCFKLLKPRAQLVWFLRVLCGMSSQETAAHPNVSLKANHVDVIQHRSREAIVKCLRRQGHEADELPTGTFVELWNTLRPVLATQSTEPSLG